MKIIRIIESLIFVLFWSISMEILNNPPKNYSKPKFL